MRKTLPHPLRQGSPRRLFRARMSRHRLPARELEHRGQGLRGFPRRRAGRQGDRYGREHRPRAVGKVGLCGGGDRGREPRCRGEGERVEGYF